MVEPEPATAGTRIVAAPGALDRARWPDGSIVVRLAPDEVLLLDADPPALEDERAIVTRDSSWFGVTVPPEDLGNLRHRVSWRVPDSAGFAQGSLGGVPVRLVVHADGSGLLLTSRTFEEELRERLR